MTMRVLCLSRRGELLPLAEHLSSSGHVVETLIADHECKCRGTSNDPRRLLLNELPNKAYILQTLNTFKPDVVLADRGMGKVADYAREQKLFVWGSSLWSDLVNSNKEYASKLLDVAGVEPARQPIVGWWNGSRLSCCSRVKREEGFLAGGAGPKTLEAVWVEPIASTRGLGKLVRTLRRTVFEGPVMLNETIEAGFSLPHVAAMSELVVGDLLGAIVDGQNDFIESHALALRISLPPYPSDGLGKARKVRPETCARRHCWMIDKGVVGGELGWVSSRGDTPRQTRRRVYRTISRLTGEVEELQFRSDL